jgi:aminotransferase
VEEAVLTMRDSHNVRRRLLVKGLNSISLPVFEPCGAFYAFPDIRAEFAMTLLEEE